MSQYQMIQIFQFSFINIIIFQFKHKTKIKKLKQKYMKFQKIIPLLILLVIGVGLILVFTFTKASPLAFLFGAIICLIIQMVLLCGFCFYKLQQTYRQSHTITLKRNSNLDPQTQYPFKIIKQKNQFYFNKYTEQAYLLNQYGQNKSKPKPDEIIYKQQQFIIDNKPKEQIMMFLKEIQFYYNSLNIFTDALVNFGKDLIYIEKSSVFSTNKFHFSNFQNSYQPQIPISQLTYDQILIFKKTNTKVQRMTGKDKLLLPSWSVVIQVLKFIGIQYTKINAMRKSNSQMLEMIHQKVLQDFNLLEKKYKKIGEQLNNTKKNIQELKKDYNKYQKAQQQSFLRSSVEQPHLEMMHWFRKQFYASRDIERRLKQNQKLQEQKTRQKKYYQQKIINSKKMSQQAFMKTIKTRYIALLDSYFITVDESIKKVQQSFYDHTYFPTKRPKVKNIASSKNLNQALQAEIQYQKQYFQRVQYFLKILQGLLNSMDGMNEFLDNLRQVFGEMIKNLKSCQQCKQKIAKYFTSLIIKLLKQCNNIFNQLNQLKTVNNKLKEINGPQLQFIRRQTKNYLQKSHKLLSDIRVQDGPIQYKFNSAKIQLQNIYKQIQIKISQIQQFQQIYMLHSGRIKKIILTNFIGFLNFQKSQIDIGQYKSNLSDKKDVNKNLKNDLSKNQNQTNQDMFPDVFLQGNSNQNAIQFDFQGLRGDKRKQKKQLSPMYIKFLNQFLFVCYTQWKTSNHFKNQLQQQLFIAFNKQPNESFSKIQVSELQFSGLPPQVVWIRQLQIEEPQAFFDAHLAFKGSIKFKINTIYKLIRDIPVQVVIQMQEFYCVLRFCFVPSEFGKGWFSFIGEPISKFKIYPSIANYRIDLETLRNLFNNFLLSKLKKNTYPIKQKILIPASRKDQDLKMIEQRFKALQEKYQ